MVSTPTTTIQTAIDLALSRIQELHPNVPHALAVTIADKRGAHGTFQADAWQDNGGEHFGSARHSIKLNPESFALGGERVLITLIHECGHALAYATGVKDTSRQGRFHNAKFRAIADSMGLLTTEDDKVGTRTIGLMEHTKHDYAEQLAALTAALVTFKKRDADKAKKPKTTVRVACGCRVPVTVPVKWYDEFGSDYMICPLCSDEDIDGGHFMPVE